ncbi:MAG TPA: MFS transporter [bacterium]|nr:MFS transporter [bacterium]HPN45936.1 MFS transporter [bacterium]
MKTLFYKYISVYRGMPKQAWLLSLVVLINRCGSMVLFFMTLYLTQQLHFSIADAGKLISIYGLGTLIGTYGGGLLSDRYGTYKIQVYSLLGAGIGYFVMLMVHSFTGLAVVLFISAAITDAFRPANISAIAQVCPPEKRARGFALNRLAINLGVTIGPVLGGFLATHDYRLLFWVDGLTSLAAGVMFWRLFHRAPIKAPDNIDRTKGSAPSPWRDTPFMFLMFIMFILGIAFFQIFNTWSLYLKNFLGFTENRIGILLALNAVMIVFMEMPLIHKVERWNPLPVIAAGSLLIMLGFAILPLYGSYLYIAFTVVVFTIGEMLVFPLTGGYIANLAQDANRGKYMGIYTLSFSLSFVIGPAAGAWVYEHWGPTILWSGIGVIGVAIFAGIMLLNHTAKPAAAAGAEMAG